VDLGGSLVKENRIVKTTLDFDYMSNLQYILYTVYNPNETDGRTHLYGHRDPNKRGPGAARPHLVLALKGNGNQPHDFVETEKRKGARDQLRDAGEDLPVARVRSGGRTEDQRRS
jgi:hypothetical protein